MWVLIPTILYLTYGEAHHHQPPPYQIVLNQRPNTYSGVPYYVVNPGLDTTVNNYQPFRPPQYANTYTVVMNPNGYYRRQSKAQYQLRATALDPDLFSDYDSSDTDRNEDLKSIEDIQSSYFTDLDLVENFGNYLKQLIQLDKSSKGNNDIAHQYTALFAVLVALARLVRNSCTTDFDEYYDQLYLETVDTYYKYGLKHAEEIAAVVADYIAKGNSRIHKLKKLKKEHCETDPLCSLFLDEKIKTYPLLFVKELETLEAVAHLAQSYFSYINEFDNATNNGKVLTYLTNNKDRLKEYVMHIVNSIDHITDTVVKCP